MSKAPKPDLLAQARAGDGRALAMLLDAEQARIYRFGLKMCRNPHDAEDVLQDTFLAATRKVQSFRGEASLSTWLFTIARRFCLKKRRKRRAQPDAMLSLGTEDTDEVVQLVDPAHPPDEATAQRQITSALEQAVSALEPKYREVLWLRDVEGLTAPEVAAALKLSVQAVKSRLHRARLFVRARVAPLLDLPARPAAADNCPDVLTLFSKHLEHEISADVCAQMEAHLGDCGRCRADCDSLKNSLALCRSLPAEEVPAHVRSSIRLAVRDLLNNAR